MNTKINKTKLHTNKYEKREQKRIGIKQESKEGSQTEFTAFLRCVQCKYVQNRQQKNNKEKIYLFRMQDEN